MALPTLSIPAFPDVPNVMGVPALIRKAQPVLDTLGYISHINNVLERMLNAPVEEVWGVFDEDGNEVLTPETFLGIGYKNGSRLMDYPLEEGAFETYNKVANPFDASISMATGGSLQDREDLLAAVDAMVQSLDFFTIVTPEVTYASVNLERYDYQRMERNGTHVIVVNLYFREIRVTAESIGNGEASATDTATPDAAAPESLGQVTPSPLSAAQDAAISGAAKVLSSVKAVTGAVGSATSAVTGAVSGAIGSATGALRTAARGITT